ncbi:GTP-binding protein [Salinadaptatus halalkaliphilus]|uniref:GTP-binding protein n=1 Tax=Salinadaptatus halalkaliphilus TaxID=2419781 RepID=A0A4S3TQI4_9EURY|nr:GTP-binding protein [Salinadaptatus halalkaliphilus]THE66659.1 GTP-binding protein [Salinadaptatus halalkaliphilus]
MLTPVTVLCGELGAGKTTLLSGLLESTDRDVAVLVNDVGAVNVDADLVEARTDLATGEEVVALENGCICCSLGGELSRSVVRLHREHAFDHLVIEASGVGEPEPIARQFVRGPAAGPYDLSSVITVVDAPRFHDRFADGPSAAAGSSGPPSTTPPADETDTAPSRQGADETGTKPLADLVLEQVEFCDLLIVNKCDLVTDAERDRVVAILETLQPAADIVATEHGVLEPETILEVQRFDLEEATDAAGWKRALEGEESADEHDHSHGDHDGHEHSQDDVDSHDHAHDGDHNHAHPPEQYGIVVDSYHRRRPLHPERFAALLEDLPAELIRAKGLCWIGGRERQAITMSYAGTETTLEVTGRWIASFSEQRQETYRQGQPDLEWDQRWGDRETRLALIGRDLDLEALTARLDDCLCTDAELEGDWSSVDNPAPTSSGESTVVSTGTDSS